MNFQSNIAKEADIKPELSQAQREHQQRVVNSIDLSGLTTAEREKVRTTLREESDVFAADDDDIGNADTVKLQIKVKDIIPCQVTDKSIPQPIHQELKGALSGLRQFWATESPLKMIKNAFYFTSKALFVLKLLKFLS